MSKINFNLGLLVLVCILSLLIGCSDDKKTTGSNQSESNPIALVDIGAIIESVAPPE